MDTNINNWNDLLSFLENKCFPFSKLDTKIKHKINSWKKKKEIFEYDKVKPNHQEIFDMYKNCLQQLLVEEDALDIFTVIESLEKNSNNEIIFNLVGPGKWIKLHSGNSDKICFIDEEKTVLNDRPLAEFLRKIDIVKPGYEYFRREPYVYYKFATIPDQEIIDFMKKFDVHPILLDKPTPKICVKMFDQKIILDQTIVITLFSNISFGLSSSYYNDKNKTEEMIRNRTSIENYIDGKEIIINQNVYDQIVEKIEKFAGPTEKERFISWKNKFKVVPDVQSPRFTCLKDIEKSCASIANQECATIVTSNVKFFNKLLNYYPELPAKLFQGVTLVEKKYQ